MINSTDAENFETGAGDQTHLYPNPESVSGSESEGKHMAGKSIGSLDPLSSNLNHNSPDTAPSKRTLQNRKAQREFRERKASYVKSLEQRIRAYESNEVQGNVELQRAARRLKDENDQLREQVRQLNERLSMVEGGNSSMSAMPPARNPGPRARASGNSSHQQQSSQPPPQSLYNTQPQGFPTNDVTAYDMMSSAPSFPNPSNPQGYFQYSAQQPHYNSYPQPHIYGQDQPGDVALNPELRRAANAREAPVRPSSTQ